MDEATFISPNDQRIISILQVKDAADGVETLETMDAPIEVRKVRILGRHEAMPDKCKRQLSATVSQALPSSEVETLAVFPPRSSLSTPPVAREPLMIPLSQSTSPVAPMIPSSQFPSLCHG